MSDFNQKLETAKRRSIQIEAILHASESPVTARQLKDWLNIKGNELDMALITLQERLSNGALTLAHTVHGFRLQIASEHSALIQAIFPERKEQLSQALLETLTIIAYKQPVTRGDIEQVRGVTVSSNILRQLFDKGWIIEKGHRDSIGKPTLLWTTNSFLSAFGLESLDELPPLPEIASIHIAGNNDPVILDNGEFNDDKSDGDIDENNQLSDDKNLS